MFAALLMVLFAGSDPITFRPNGPPFASRAACEMWAAEEARRIEHIVETTRKRDRPTRWEMLCKPLGLRSASLDRKPAV